MKLRRAMAVAAATAVITPAAFLMAPAAYATDSTPSATESSSPAATPSEDTATSETTTPTEDEKSQEPTTEEESKTEQPKTDTPAAGTTTAPAPSTSASAPAPSTSPSSSPSPSEPVLECETFEENDGLRSTLVGLPSKVVAGSGWQNFSFRVENKTGHDVEGVDAYLYADAIDENGDFAAQYLTVQAYIGDTWVNIGDEDGYFGTSNALKKNEYTEAQMRLKVDAKAPAGYGFAFASGVSFTRDGLCELGEETEYEFEILAAGTDAGDVDDAEGKPGKGDKKPDTKPQGELAELPVTGTLAETGSNSMLPTIGIAGGIAIVAGAGVVFALKRRQNGAAA